MKIASRNFETLIETSSQRITSLVIEDERTLYKFLVDIKNAVAGLNSEIVFSRDDIPVNPSKEVILITDFICFDINQKHLISKIISELQEKSVDERFYETSQCIIGKFEEYIMEMAMDLPCEIIADKLNIQNMLKNAGISVLDDYDSLEERVLAYMDMVRALEGEKLFIFANLKCLIPYERFRLMTEDALLKEHEILFVDSTEHFKLDKEKLLIIDKDLCEF